LTLPVRIRGSHRESGAAQVMVVRPVACRMKPKNIAAGMLFAVPVVLSCFLGYRLKTERAYWMREERGNIAWHVGLYHAAEAGAYQNNRRDVRSDFGGMVLEDVLVYQKQFGEDAGTDVFSQKYADAKLIARQIRGQLVPMSSILTNFPHASNLAPDIFGPNK